ncbi:MAG: hypothetical protein QJR02_00160 [Sinobacteraceae bacterium]|nr:hypothetical protein [Nevskiaceae bacterium]
MSRAFSKIAIAQAVIKNIESAFDKYLEMSGDWLDDAPESYVVCSIADSLYKRMRGNGWVALECPVSDFLDDSDEPGDRRGRPPKALRSEGRFDITLYWKDGASRAPIEVKHPIVADKTILDSDARRLCSALREGGMQFGMLAFYISSDEPKRKDDTPEGRIIRRRDEIKALLQKIAGGNKYPCAVSSHHGRVHKKDGSAWSASCIIFEPMS